MLTKVVINANYGCFELSHKAKQLLRQLGYCWNFKDIPRHNPLLVHVVETLGQEATVEGNELAITHVRGRFYRIHEYDGREYTFTPEELQWIQIC